LGLHQPRKPLVSASLHPLVSFATYGTFSMISWGDPEHFLQMYLQSRTFSIQVYIYLQPTGTSTTLNWHLRKGKVSQCSQFSLLWKQYPKHNTIISKHLNQDLSIHNKSSFLLKNHWPHLNPKHNPPGQTSSFLQACTKPLLNTRNYRSSLQISKCQEGVESTVGSWSTNHNKRRADLDRFWAQSKTIQIFRIKPRWRRKISERIRHTRHWFPPTTHPKKKGEKNAPPSELLQTTPRTEHTKVKHMSKVQKSSHNEKDNCSKPPLSRKKFPSHLKLSAQSNFPLVFSACSASIHESPRM
jgi:hypothetical protein